MAALDTNGRFQQFESMQHLSKSSYFKFESSSEKKIFWTLISL